MTAAPKRNLPASVRQRLLDLAAKRREAFDLVLIRFAIERLLYRLSRSPHADRFLLKGAMLFVVWAEGSHRPTRDLDLLGVGPAEESETGDMFRGLCAVAVEPDGLEYLADTVRVSPIREAATYAGLRVKLEARLANIKIPLQVDIGFGDTVTPAAETIAFPALLDFPSPQLRAYPVYTVVAEKAEALVALGENNTRMKDFFDLWFLGRTFDFDGATLARAIRATFSRRHTTLPAETPPALTERFATERAGSWAAFAKRNGQESLAFASIVEEIRAFIGPVLEAAARNREWLRHKKAGNDWS